MSRSLHLLASAKVNWSLEVLGRRDDGYHEVRTVLQTIALADCLTLTPAEGVTLSLGGEAGYLATEPTAENLAYRAAELLRERTGYGGGGHIEIEKHVPVAAGLGGGSSDAAATLRGLRQLWELSISNEALASLAAELGSDVPFFLRGGAAFAAGRGETLEPLPDLLKQSVVIVWPQPRPQAEKTATMYAALRRIHFTDGSRTERLAERLRAGEPVRDEDLYNVFEAVLPEVDPEAAEVFEQAAEIGVGQPHLCGSGPALFYLLAPGQPVEPQVAALERLGLHAAETAALPAAEAVAREEAR